MSSKPAILAALPAAAIVAAGALAYASSFSGDFIFDSRKLLTDARIQRLWPPWDILLHSDRPVVDLSFAINHAIGGFNVRGYHAVNLAIHFAAALVLYGLVRRSLTPAIRNSQSAIGVVTCLLAADPWRRSLLPPPASPSPSRSYGWSIL